VNFLYFRKKASTAGLHDGNKWGEIKGVIRLLDGKRAISFRSYPGINSHPKTLEDPARKEENKTANISSRYS